MKGASFPSQLPFTPNNSANGFTRNGIFNSKSPTMNTNNNFNGNLDKAINISSNINKSFNEIREKGVIEKLLVSSFKGYIHLYIYIYLQFLFNIFLNVYLIIHIMQISDVLIVSSYTHIQICIDDILK